MSHSTTRSSLIRRVKSKDEAAWRQLNDLYGPLVYHWCRRFGLDGHDAADVFQEVFATVARAVGKFEPQRERGTFRGWLWTITRNKARDYYRAEHQRAVAAGGSVAQRQMVDVPDPFNGDVADDEDRSEHASLFHRALESIRAEFEPRTWRAFWHAAVLERPTPEIAEQLGISPASVRQAKSRVLRRLRQALGDLDG